MVSQASVLPPSISLTVFGVCKEHDRIEKYTEKRDVIRNVISLLWRSRRHPAVERALGVQRATAGCVSVSVCMCRTCSMLPRAEKPTNWKMGIGNGVKVVCCTCLRLLWSRSLERRSPFDGILRGMVGGFR